jgi:hypothetical protein
MVETGHGAANSEAFAVEPAKTPDLVGLPLLGQPAGNPAPRTIVQPNG